MSLSLTEEQKRRIEENRQKALARRAERLTAQQQELKQSNGGKVLARTINQTCSNYLGGWQQYTKQGNQSEFLQQNTHNPNGPVQGKLPSAKQRSNPAVGSSLKGHSSRSEPVDSVQNSSSPCSLSSDNQKKVQQTSSHPELSQPSYPPKFNKTTASVPSGSSTLEQTDSSALTPSLNRNGLECVGKEESQSVTSADGVSSCNSEMKSDSGTKNGANVSQFYGAKQAVKPFSASGTIALTDGKAQVPSVSSGGAISGTAPLKKGQNVLKGKCVKHSEDRFRVEVGYNAELISLFKTVPSKNYDPVSKMWNFNLEDYSDLMEAVQCLPAVTLQPLEGMDTKDFPHASLCSSTGSGIKSLLLMCKNWKKPSATLRGRCVLISRSRFEVDIGYHPDCIGAFKQMGSRNYDMKTRKWSFLLEDYQRLSEALHSFPSLEVEPLPKAVIQTLVSQFEKTSTDPASVPEAELSMVDSKLVNNLMPFQREGVNFAVSREGRLLLADDMGLGKTIQAICIAAYYRKEWPLLVVAPSSVRFTWAEAIHRWLPSIDPDSISVIVTGKDSLSASLVNIVSYDLLCKMDKQMTASFKVVIIDESHFLKNMKTARCKAAMPLLKAARRVILLSGTPAMSRPSELYTQITAVKPSFFPRFHDFGLRYCDAKKMPWGWDYSGSANLNELKLLLEESLMIRRLKADVLSQLPAKQRKMVIVATEGMNAKARAALAAAAKEMTKGYKNKRQEKEALLLFYNRTAEAKVQCAVEYIVDLLESGREKFLVFAHHKLVLDAVCEELERKEVGHIRIDGCTPSAERQNLCQKFQFSEKCQVAVLSLTAANMGITLSAADLVVFAELFWNPGVLIQAEDRVHRIGQSSSVNIHYLVAKCTADDYLWPMIQEKMKVLGQAGLSETNFSETTESTDFFYKDPKQKTIYDLFQRSFSEDGDELDEALLLEACQEIEQESTTPSVDITASASPCKKRRIDDFFSKH
ncbi:SNF2 related chromatin remodeling annealing helicase 1 isoform X1 [Microcaecilia unicolor]|uniref:SWI/SNF-related matrix-associated actin-dependent regulator of chromatin subfamily A-like protein 1 n=1 Tax=Microcaecilia unicolor TaxID=1415580 RepID=A0A6P7YR02_9AMPH|nr:SWI/SNF-related matrix-associated actin-dependent regulator of chromatin subfamily A-like protein 1 isoform X1 [Microcaecilia unicolor]XP_030065570.1 SWI/SNF-related matrix-associated actin-dependent regulator of chromatin subfamily A-like protein 1 isoform X1 [Microcaecilia unicolor]